MGLHTHSDQTFRYIYSSLREECGIMTIKPRFYKPKQKESRR